MKDREIYRVIKDSIGPYLESQGFTSERSRQATYHRKVSEELFHVIGIDLFRNRRTFDVYVCPCSPRFGSWANFPDGLPIVSGNKGRLHVTLGVGQGASRFSCVSELALEAAINKALLPSIEKFAVPYLEQFKCLADIAPILEHAQWASLLEA